MPGDVVAVCIHNKAKLDRDTTGEFERELATIARASGMELRFVPCSGFDSVLRITVENRSAMEGSALGAARTAGGRVMPEFEVYAGRIAELLPVRLPKLMGRAMARVAAHELGHYFLQTQQHGADVMTEVFTGARLVVNDHRRFLIPRAREGSIALGCGSE
jgi:hypothetical protein